ncbi:type I DNA topoisomerase [Leptospira sp. 96542]|nr:type I DNA topoisomerase [Leptospira sp. 96542]
MVESPTKAKTLSSYLDSDWEVVASKGHIKDLPPDSYGVDVSNGFEPTYTWLKGKKTVVSAITTKAKKSNIIYISSDPDREGEIIAKHLFDELKRLKKPIHRIRLKEITKSELKTQIANPSGLDLSQINSQIARRVVDRIFGYEISPDLWKHLKIGSLSAGRVQSCVLHWICERENEILNFIPEDYFLLKLIGTVKSEEVILSFREPNKKKLNKDDINQILKSIGLGKAKNLQIPLTKINKKNIKRNPPQPFTTASLQEMAFRTLGFDSKKTMSIAQKLFEGKKNSSGEMKGLITYMRTDSTFVSSEKRNLGLDFLKKHHPNLKTEEKVYRTKKKKHAQAAHEAILPVDPFLTRESLFGYLDVNELKLYNMIWERFLCSLMEPEVGIEYQYIFTIKDFDFEFKEEVISNFGFKQFQVKKDKTVKKQKDWKVGDLFEYKETLLEEKSTECPPRYTEGKLIQKMEERGVGRPSTYVNTIETLYKRKYIVEFKKSIGPTELGKKVDGYLYLNFPTLIGEEFTKNLELDLDQVSDQNETRIVVIKKFYDYVKKALKQPDRFRKPIGEVFIDSMELSDPKEKSKIIKDTIPICPKCNDGKIQSKFAKNGKTIFFCSRYPHCDYITYENKRS